MKDLWSVVFGAALALMGTVVVQRWLVPRAQIKIRQRERWEEDLRELADLLAKELPEAAYKHVSALRSCIPLQEGGRDQSASGDHPRIDADAKERLRGLEEDLRRALRLAGVLIRRVRSVNPDAPGWEVPWD